MIIFFAAVEIFFEATAGGDISFYAEDRFNAARSGFFVKFNGGVEIAVVGDGDGIHSKLFDAIHQFGDFG